MNGLSIRRIRLRFAITLATASLCSTISTGVLAQSLDSVVPAVQQVHGLISLRGNDFGTTQGTSTVRFTDGVTTVDAGRAYLWRDDRIEIRVPVGMRQSGSIVPIPKSPLSVFVETAEGSSEGLSFEVITEPTGVLAFTELTRLTDDEDTSSTLGFPNMNLARTKEAEIGDVNADGFPDILDNNSINIDNDTHHVLRLNNHDRTFTALALEPRTSGETGEFATVVPPGGSYSGNGVTYDVDFADITGDGLPDIIQTMTASVTSNFLRLLINGHDGIAGQFTEDSTARLPASAFSLSACPDDIDHGDIDNDGDIDFAITLRRFGACGGTPPESSTHLYVNDGTGVFSDPIVFPAPDTRSSHDVFFIDANNDRFTDIMIVYEDGTGSQLHLNNGDAIDVAFTPGDEFPTGLAGTVADYNGDGFEDFVIGQDSATVFLNNPLNPGDFTESPLPLIGSGSIYDFEAGDLDLDGDIDIVGTRITTVANDAAIVWLNRGDGEFTLASDGTATTLLPGIGDIQRMSADLLDIDMDGDLDLYLAGPDGQRVDSGFVFKLPNQLFLNRVRSFDIVEPTTRHPAHAGNSSEGKRVFVRLRDPGGPPISLVDLSATVGGVPAPFITGAQIEGEFWALIDAPSHPDGCYELSVDRAGAPSSNDIEKGSICYEDNRNFSRVVTIDRTNSMNRTLGVFTREKMTAAQEAAKMFVDLSQGGDQIGVVSFQRVPDDGDGVVELPELVRRDIPLELAETGGSDNRPMFRGVIAGIEPGGPGFVTETSIGAGVIESLTMLQSSGNPGHEHEIVVITDGEENFAPFWRNPGSGGPAHPRVLAASPKTRVHTVAIGRDANALLLQEMAESTEGRFRNLVDEPGPIALSMSARLSESLKSVDEHIREEQRFFHKEGLPDKPDAIRVEPDLTEASIAFYWDADDALEIFLLAPDGTAVTDALPGVSVEKDARHVVYRIIKPEAGEWEYRFERRQDSDFDFFVAASGLSPVVMRRGPATLHHYDEGGFDIPIRVLLSDYKPITTADIDVRIERPDGSDMHLVLRDEGLEADGGFADGIYGMRFKDTQRGPYDVTITATGTSNNGNPFVRYLRYSFVYQTGKRPEGPGEPPARDGRRAADLVVQPFDGDDIQSSCPAGPNSCVTTVKLSILNVGDQQAPSTQTQVMSNPNLQQGTNQIIPILNPGDKFDFEFRSSPGRSCFDPFCVICVIADTTDSVRENDENNNRRCALKSG